MRPGSAAGNTRVLFRPASNFGSELENWGEDCRRSQNCLATSPSGTPRLEEGIESNV